jgi:signal transduction histidine kinase
MSVAFPPTMPNLPATRQKEPRAEAGARSRPQPESRRLSKPHSRMPPAKPTEQSSAQRSLVEAFVSFTQVAGSLEKSYAQLQGEVGRLRGELARANSELTSSHKENTRVRSFLARIVKGLPCGVIVLQEDGKLSMLNPEAQQLLAIDANWNENGKCAPPPVVRTLLSKAAPLQKEDSTPSECTLELPAGERTFATACTRIAESPDGRGRATILILRDITDEKRIAQEREAARRVQALAEISTLLAHEIRNPLGSLELFAGLISDATSQLPDARQWVDHLQAGLRGLSATVNNVLHFHSQPSAERAPTDLKLLLRQTVDFLRPLARQKNMQISLICRVEEGSIAADSHRLQQVFFNLALNGFRAMAAGGTLFIRVDRAAQGAGERLQIVFEDQGAGIEAEHLARIFEPGFTTKTGSPGLGLSLCKTVMEQHEGAISVQTVLGRGTSFTLLFPALRGDR